MRGTSGTPVRSAAPIGSAGLTSERTYSNSASALFRESSAGCGTSVLRNIARTAAGESVRTASESSQCRANDSHTSFGAPSMSQTPSARSASASAGGAGSPPSGNIAVAGATHRLDISAPCNGSVALRHGTRARFE